MQEILVREEGGEIVRTITFSEFYKRLKRALGDKPLKPNTAYVLAKRNSDIMPAVSNQPLLFTEKQAEVLIQQLKERHLAGQPEYIAGVVRDMFRKNAAPPSLRELVRQTAGGKHLIRRMVNEAVDMGLLIAVKAHGTKQEYYLPAGACVDVPVVRTNVTSRAQEVVDAITEIHRRGVPASINEVNRVLGMQCVEHHLARLREEGIVKYTRLGNNRFPMINGSVGRVK